MEAGLQQILSSPHTAPIVLTGVGLSACHLILVNLLPHVLPRTGKFATVADPKATSRLYHDTAQEIVTFFVSLVLFIQYTRSVLDPALNGSTEARLIGVTPLSASALRLHLGQTAYELGLYAVVGRSWELWLHHVAIILNYGWILGTSRLHFYGCWLGTVEGTNPCLSAVYSASRLDFSTLASACGAMLFLGFFVLRVIHLPLVFLSAQRDNTHDLLVSGPARWQYDLGRVTILFLWLLSCYWWSLMVQKVRKMMKGSGTETATTTQGSQGGSHGKKPPSKTE